MKRLFLLNKEKTLKALISLGIIAIFISLFIQYGVPYLKEISLERQDKVRIKDLDTLSGLMKDLVSTSSTKFIGNGKTIYISLPSANSTCSDLNLPSVPEGWSYHCSATSTLTNTDGTGWIPINFSNRIIKLPIDSINSFKTLDYYAYVASSTREYVITAVLDSKKNLNEKAQNDNGIDSIRYEIGNNLKLWGNSYGLSEYWSFNDTINGTKIFNRLDNNRVISLNDNNSIVKINGKQVLKLNGINQYLDLGTSKKIETKSISVSTSFIPYLIPQNSGIIQKGTPGYAAFSYGFFIQNDQLIFGIKNDTESLNLKFGPIQKNNKYDLVGTFDSKNKLMSFYVDGVLVGQINSSSGIDYTYSPSLILGNNNSNYYNGIISDIKIFNRVLSKNEVLKMNE